MKPRVWQRISRALRKPWREQLRSTVRGLQWLLAPAWTRIEWGLRPWSRTAAHGLPRRVVVTLTSYPARYATLALTLKSLLNQTVRPDQVVLWLHEPDVARLPASVLRLQSEGLQIRGWPDDLRSYKKLVPLLRLEPQTIAVTADDDARYPRRWLEELLVGHALHPQAVLCHRAHWVTFDDAGQPQPYRRWPKASEARGPDGALFFTGIGGVLFPPGALHADATDTKLFTALCPDADDIWLNAMVRRRGTPVLRVGRNARFPTWIGTQRGSLFRRNARGNGNDESVRRVVEAYGVAVLGGGTLHAAAAQQRTEVKVLQPLTEPQGATP